MGFDVQSELEELRATATKAAETADDTSRLTVRARQTHVSRELPEFFTTDAFLGRAFVPFCRRSCLF
jgi:hypothetical protein